VHNIATPNLLTLTALQTARRFAAVLACWDLLESF